MKEFCKQDAKSVIIGLRSCGFDLFMDRLFPASFQECFSNKTWTLDQDEAIVKLAEQLALKLNTSPLQIAPAELYLNDADRADPVFKCLQFVSSADVHFHFCLIQWINKHILTTLLPLIDFRGATTYPQCLAAILRQGKGLIFKHTKEEFLNKILAATQQRSEDIAPPEIVVDPVSDIGNSGSGDVTKSFFCQVMNQIAEVPTSHLLVPPASGKYLSFKSSIIYCFLNLRR